MTETTAETPVEKPVQFKKKFQTWGLATGGIVFVVLGLMTVYDIATRNNTVQVTQSVQDKQQLPVVEAAPANVTELVQQRIDEKQAVTTFRDTPAKSSTANLTGYLANTLTNTMDPKADAQRNWEVAELTRGLTATRSSWQLNSTAIPEPAIRPVSSRTAAAPSMEEKRLAVAKRIEEVQRLQASLQRGDVSGLTPQQTAPPALKALNRTFSPPPANIAGYTGSNKYNANIDGKLKLPVGTLIPAITAMKTMSDYVGTFKAMVNQDVYDVNYEYVLIPKGSDVQIKSVKNSNVNEPIQARIGYTVQWVVLPDGKRIDMSKSTGLDREGVAAIKDEVDYHFMAQFLGVAAYALIANETSYTGSGANSDQSYAGTVGDNLRQQASPLAQKYLSLTPTKTIRAGQPINIILEDELYIDPWLDIYKDYL